MAVIKGVKEKVHLPLYDSISVKPARRLGETQSSNVLRFFQDVTGKTKLETNMQASSLLPHWNTFEARAMRVVISDLAAQFPDKEKVDGFELPIVEPEGEYKKATLNGLTLGTYVELSRRLEACCQESIRLSNGDITALDLTVGFPMGFPEESKDRLRVGLDRGKLDELAQALQDKRVVLPPLLQIFPNNGAGNLISQIIYNSVTTFFVGEKVMIQVPTWFFPSGAGPYAEDGKVVTHGYPSPQATFRFAEPIFIDTQQNFRVEIEIPENDVLRSLQNVYGPLFVWVVIDGYMTRDVQ